MEYNKEILTMADSELVQQAQTLLKQMVHSKNIPDREGWAEELRVLIETSPLETEILVRYA
jgi:hypothetical protein